MPNPTNQPDYGLFYVGISPRSATSKATIRSRVIRQHVRGNTGSSTFRYALASLLLDELRLQPIACGTKVVLSSEQNRQLTDWQFANLALTWCERPNPWEIEADVIAAMQPPLNAAGNQSHAFYGRVRDARAAFRPAAAPAPPRPTAS